jgi:TP901 family phage tail tape measure protein
LTAQVEVKEGAMAFTEYKVAVEGADRSIRLLKGNTRQLPGFLDSVKRKLGEISQYVSAMSIISRAGMELRKGIQYIRDIDLALTELKKVTDETEETYDKFLDTASKTAAKVGSTIKDVISSTADWARLGYAIEDAAKFAESTQILMNVSEFTDVSRATDTLISSVQAFGYTAETSMEVVDLLNTIGNNYAISTADLASSLTKSSASLVAAGGDLAEAAALTATANAIIQD